MSEGDVILISICFMILYIIKNWMLIDMVFSYYVYTMLLLFLLCFCIELPFVKILHEAKIVDLLDSDDKEEVNGEEYLRR